jgi:hypothetical protein
VHQHILLNKLVSRLHHTYSSARESSLNVLWLAPSCTPATQGMLGIAHIGCCLLLGPLECAPMDEHIFAGGLKQP